MRLDSALNRPSLDLAINAINLALKMVLVDLFLDSLDSLVGECLVFEHCVIVSNKSQSCDARNLQKANSSRVRLYVSGYMKYTNIPSNVIHPQ
jgi:hypothetical protein